MSDFWQFINSISVDNLTLTIAWLLVVANWRSPIIRNLALVNVVIAMIGSELMTYISQLPLQQAKYFWYLGASSINFIKALIILGFISFNIAYMCKTAGYLMVIFTMLGILNMTRFFERFLLGYGAYDGWLGSSYSVLMPALNFLALLALTLPIWQQFRASKKTNRPTLTRN